MATSEKEMPKPGNIGDAIRGARESRGWSRHNLSMKTGEPVTNIENWELHVSEPQFAKYVILARAFDWWVPVDADRYAESADTPP